MSKARQQANLSSDGNLFADISNDRVGIGSVVPTHKLHVAGTSKFDDDVRLEGTLAARRVIWDKSENAIELGDYTYAKFGLDDDLTVWSNDTASAINNKTGELRILSGTNVRILKRSDAGLGFAGQVANFNIDGACDFYHNGTKRIETLSTGAKVTGNLEVTGVLTYDDVTSIDSVGIVTARQGIFIDDSITHIGDTDTKIRFPAADAFSVETAGSERLRIRSDGNIGVGNWGTGTIPQTLSLKGSMYLRQNDVITWNNGDGDISCISGYHLRFRTYDGSSNTEKLRITSTGQITQTNFNGIGFHMSGGQDPSIRIQDTDGTNQYADFAHNGGDSYIVTRNNTSHGVFRVYSNNGSETKNRLVIDSSGRVMLGTSTAGLATGDEFVIHTDAHTGMTIRSGNTHEGNIFFGDSDYGAAGIIRYEHNNNAMLFKTNSEGQEKLRIDSAGDIFIGTTSDIAPTNGTNLCVSDATISRLILEKQSTIKFGLNVSNGFTIYDETNDAARFSIDSSGRVGFGGLTPSNYYSTYDDFVWGSTSGSVGMTIVSGSDGSGYISWADGTSSADQYRGRIFYQHTDNAFRFRCNGLAHDILKIDSSQVYITSNNTDGVLNLDTSGSNGTFIRFKRAGTTKSWVGMSQGLGAYGDNDDLTLLTTDKIILATNSAPHVKLDSDGQLQVGVTNGGTVWNQTDSGTRFHTHLCTGSFYSGTGAIVIRTMIPSHDVTGHTMFSVRITGYWYSNTTGGCIDCVVGCYSGENAYYNPSITGTYPNNWQDNVKFAKCTSGTYNNKMVIVLGTTSGANDCEIACTDFVQGFSGTSIDYARNWTMIKTTDISDYNGSANKAIHRANEHYNEEFRTLGDGYGEFMFARKGKRSTIQGEYQYTQMNQGHQYKHYIKSPNGDNDITDDFAGMNWSALISVGVVGTSTANTACHYYAYDNSDNNNQIVLQHRFGNSSGNSNQCYMQLYNNKAAWLMDHATGYRVTVRVKFLSGGEDGSTYTTAEGDYGSN